MNIKGYILSIIAAAILCAVISGLVEQKTATGQLIRLLGGILMAITVIAPITSIRFTNITDYLNDLTVSANVYVEQGTVAAQESIGGIIKSQTQAYILDKANRMGLEIAVEVELDDSNDQSPSGVTITGALSPYAKEILSSYITDTLGIAKENQQWK